jgi:protein-disulfide isomerase
MLGLGPRLDAQTNPVEPPIARIGEQVIYERDLMPSIGAQLLQLKNQEYELKLKGLANVLKERLLENEAVSKGLSTEAFLEQYVDRNVPAPSPSEIEAFYLAQKDAYNQPLDDVKVQVEGALTRARRQRARQIYMDSLQHNATLSILLDRPRVQIDPDPLRMRGAATAPITIIEFGDFQCPYCQGAEQILKSLMDKYKDKLRVGFRDFPLKQIHPDAQQAAEASRCAGEQGKFWEYHDLLYANQSRLDANGLREHARAVGLDLEKFSACLTSWKFTPAVENDFRLGLASGVSSTPSFFVNGIVISGLQPASSFEKIIDSELADRRTAR